jgi:hypothetical protein
LGLPLIKYICQFARLCALAFGAATAVIALQP